jgi:hypothetical protein
MKDDVNPKWESQRVLRRGCSMNSASIVFLAWGLNSQLRFEKAQALQLHQWEREREWGCLCVCVLYNYINHERRRKSKMRVSKGSTKGLFHEFDLNCVPCLRLELTAPIRKSASFTTTSIREREKEDVCVCVRAACTHARCHRSRSSMIYVSKGWNFSM